MVISEQQRTIAENHGLHPRTKIFRDLFSSLSRLFLTIATAALLVGGFTACAPLENPDVAMAPPSQTIVRPSKPKAPPAPAAALKKENPAPQEEITLENVDPQALKLVVTPEIKELAKLDAWDTLPLLSTGEEAESDNFPLAMNDQVEYYLDFFKNRHRKTFARWLARSSRYLPMIKKEFAKAGLPEDLAYLPMIESGFNTTVSSRASAVGTWQFMRGTGKNYGLTVNNYVDERRDPVKSTKAAVAYLANLHKMFDDWHLAIAAYNAGEGKIKKAMKQSDTDDFWEIAQSRYIQSETKLYVPQLIAAIMIAKDPAKYGFDDIDYDEPLEYETVRVPRATPIKAVALACSLPDEEILILNRQLSKAITPPSEADYPLRVPVGKKDLVLKNLPRVHQVKVTEFNTHEVGRGETLTTISRKYKVSKTTLLKANHFEQERLSLGQHIRIPYQTIAYKISDDPQHFDRAGAANIPVFSMQIEPSDTKAGKKKRSRCSKKKKGTSAKRVLSTSTKEKKSTHQASKERTKKSRSGKKR